MGIFNSKKKKPRNIEPGHFQSHGENERNSGLGMVKHDKNHRTAAQHPSRNFGHTSGQIQPQEHRNGHKKLPSEEGSKNHGNWGSSGQPRQQNKKRASLTFEDTPGTPYRGSNKVTHDQPDVSSLTVTPKYTTIKGDLLNLLKKKHIPLFFVDGRQYPHLSGNVSGDFWKWNDSSYVRLPIDPTFYNWNKLSDNLMKLKDACASGALTKQSKNVGQHMFRLISTYQRNATTESDFGILSGSISEHVVGALPTIIDLALKLPELLSSPIPYLQQDSSATLYFTKELCSSLLAHCFLCTIPERGHIKNIRDINFFRLFSTSKTEEKSAVKSEKLMCLLNYFVQMGTSSRKDHIISFERKVKKGKFDWALSSKPLTQVQVDSKGKIEEKADMLQVDFANKNVGGGVLNDGSVMEEIRFCISPEMILSRLFTQTLKDNEVLVMTGTEQFSKYTGYASSFQYVGPDNQSHLKEDNLGRLKTEVVALDALSFKKSEAKEQFSRKNLDRELSKCLVGFSAGLIKSSVATGNWGCGAFNGDQEFKFLIQLMAASEAERHLCYHTIGDEEQGERIEEIVKSLGELGVTVGQLYNVLVNYYADRYHTDSVFDFVTHNLTLGGASGKQAARSSMEGGSKY